MKTMCRKNNNSNEKNGDANKENEGGKTRREHRLNVNRKKKVNFDNKNEK